ncbi:uncharacterized protein [Tiliqua scincoides]|uniref:uncharacterized protein n=1 Tax=Tiliqua scincoides TaxID=71010 RepID=UPI003461919C
MPERVTRREGACWISPGAAWEGKGGQQHPVGPSLRSRRWGQRAHPERKLAAAADTGWQASKRVLLCPHAAKHKSSHVHPECTVNPVHDPSQMHKLKSKWNLECQPLNEERSKGLCPTALLCLTLVLKTGMSKSTNQVSISHHHHHSLPYNARRSCELGNTKQLLTSEKRSRRNIQWSQEPLVSLLPEATTSVRIKNGPSLNSGCRLSPDLGRDYPLAQ